MLLPQYWRLGFATEVLMALLQLGFETIGFHRIEADINPANEASIRLCKKLGFIQEAHLRQNFYFEGRFIDTVIMGMLKEDWIEKRQNN
jgi:ribosomal-protein-alanine N-acetyltransferase